MGNDQSLKNEKIKEQPNEQIVEAKEIAKANNEQDVIPEKINEFMNKSISEIKSLNPYKKVIFCGISNLII